MLPRSVMNSRRRMSVLKLGAHTKGANQPLERAAERPVCLTIESVSCAYCAFARTFGNGEIEPVGSLSGFIGVPAGAFGGNGDAPAPDVSEAVFPAGSAAVASAIGVFGLSAADESAPAAPAGETAD